MEKEWVLEIQKKYEKAKVPFYFKQWGGRNKKLNGSELNGRYYKEIPLKQVA